MTTLPQNYDRRGRLESVLMVTQDVTAEKERERDYQLQLKKDGGGRRARQHRQNGLPAPHEPRYPHAD